MVGSKGCLALSYLKSFMASIDNGIDAVTLHDYYLNGRKASQEDFLNPGLMDGLSDKVQIFKTAFPKRKFWLGETGSAYGGGAKGISDR